MINNQKSIINTHLENTLRMQLKNEGKQEWEIDSRVKYAHFANELFLNGCSEQHIVEMVQKIKNEEVLMNSTSSEGTIE